MYTKNTRYKKVLYRTNDINPFKLSRSKLDLFIECPRCFYLDRKLGVGRPPGFPFSLNSAVDYLLKQEFDAHRSVGKNHPLIEKYGVDARPVPHEELNIWRENFKGLQYLHEKTNFLITGAIDDLWQNSHGEYIIVDYKATSKNKTISALDESWQDGYKRQMEIYQWLLRKKGYSVSSTGYFVYCNGKTDRKAFDSKLEFEISLIPYVGTDSWIEKTIIEVKKCLDNEKLPKVGKGCNYCAYRKAVKDILEST